MSESLVFYAEKLKNECTVPALILFYFPVVQVFS